MNFILIFIIGCIFSFLAGYNYCRHTLHKIAKDTIGSYLTANLFGYPPPESPTIEELEKILNEEKRQNAIRINANS